MAEKEKRKPSEELLGDSQQNNNALLGLFGTHGLTRAQAKRLIAANPNDQHRLIQDLANGINLLDAGGNTLVISRTSTVPKNEFGELTVDYILLFPEQVSEARKSGMDVSCHLEGVFTGSGKYSRSVAFEYCLLENNSTPEGDGWGRAGVEHLLAYAIVARNSLGASAKRVTSSDSMLVLEGTAYYCEVRPMRYEVKVVVAGKSTLTESFHLWVREKNKLPSSDWEI